MKIEYFRIENFRNIKLAECENPPDFMVICGGNGCGKSAVLEALIAAKAYCGGAGGFTFDHASVSADSDAATVEIRLRFNDEELAWYSRTFDKMPVCPPIAELRVQFPRRAQANVEGQSIQVNQMLSAFALGQPLPGYFDYFDAHRLHPKQHVANWSPTLYDVKAVRNTLGAAGQSKFQHAKMYLTALAMKDVQDAQRSMRAGRISNQDSLSEIKRFFNGFFAPMEFVEVRFDASPFRFVVRTPRGEFDLDDLSSGEKEVLNVFTRFQQLRPKGSIILFDEPDAHLHPELERRYLELLRKLGAGNQLWLTTHSPEMMISAGSESLYTIDRHAPGGENQLRRVSTDDARHDVLAEVMGSRGLVAFNQKVVFIEGTDSSADREVYEHFYPPSVHNLSFVPAGNSSSVRALGNRVTSLLESRVGFQQYFSIVDGDMRTAGEDECADGRLFILPVYHVENLLLDETAIFDTTRSFLKSACPYTDPAGVLAVLRELLFDNGHLRAFAKARYESTIDGLVRAASKAIRDGTAHERPGLERPDFESVLRDSHDILKQAIAGETWRAKCKGRDLLKAYCSRHEQMPYRFFRRILIERFRDPPAELAGVMRRILAT